VSSPINVTATGNVTGFTGPSRLGTVSLVSGGAASTVVIRDGGSGGTIIKQLAAPTGDSRTETPVDSIGQQVTGQLHVTLTGAGSSVNLEQV
jgi:hypothetical protein